MYVHVAKGKLMLSLVTLARILCVVRDISRLAIVRRGEA